MTDLPQLLDLQVVAERLSVSADTLREWARKREFPRLYRLGRHWRVAADDVLTWLAERPGSPEQDALRLSFLQHAGGSDSPARRQRASRVRASAGSGSSSGGSHDA